MLVVGSHYLERTYRLRHKVLPSRQTHLRGTPYSITQNTAFLAEYAKLDIIIVLSVCGILPGRRFPTVGKRHV